LTMPRTRAVDPAAPAVEVRRSARRRRTVSAYRDGDVTVVLIPARFSKAEERRWVAEMIARLQAREARRQRGPRRSDEALLARGRQLSTTLFDGRTPDGSRSRGPTPSLRSHGPGSPWYPCEPGAEPD